MNLEWIRAFCLGRPGATEEVQWENHLLFKVGGKMFAIGALEPANPTVLSFKASLEDFAELTERPGIIPAPHLARASWVALEKYGALRKAEYERLIQASYDQVVAKLPKSKQPKPKP